MGSLLRHCSLQSACSFWAGHLSHLIVALITVWSMWLSLYTVSVVDCLLCIFCISFAEFVKHSLHVEKNCTQASSLPANVVVETA